MEHNNNLNRGYSALRDISASQMNTLLNFDSPPETPLDPSQMLLSNSHHVKSSFMETDCRLTQESSPDCSILRFNNQPLPSQIESHFDFPIFSQRHNDDDDDRLIPSWSLSNSDNRTEKENAMKAQDSPPGISTQELDEMLLDINEFPERNIPPQKSHSEVQSIKCDREITNSVIITSPDIEQITLEDTEPILDNRTEKERPIKPQDSAPIISTQELDEMLLDINEFPEMLEINNCPQKTQSQIESFQSDQEMTDSVIITSPDVEQITLEDTELMLDDSSAKTFTANELNFTKVNRGNEINTSVLTNTSQKATNQENCENVKITKPNVLEFSSKENHPKSNSRTDVNDFSTKVHDSSTKSIHFFSSSQDDDDDIDMDDIDFNQLNALEQAFIAKKDNMIHVPRMCETQLELNSVRPSTTEKVVASCPTPVLKPIAPTPTESMHPMDFLEVNYSRTTSSRTPSITSDKNSQHLNMTLNFTMTQDSTTFSNILQFDETPQDIENSQNKTPSSKSHEPDPIPTSNTCKSESTSSVTISSIGSKTPSLALTLFQINNSTADATMMPSSVKQLYDVIKEQYSDFSFIYALSTQLCQDRIPMDCFITLKMGLLLSLASIGPNPHMPPIPIIAVGNDTYMANYLMTTVGQLASRFVGPTEDTKPPSSSGYRNLKWIEADPILLAKGGVYYVGDWSRLKLLRADRIFKDIESSLVAIDNSTHQYALETAIWAHWRSFKYNSKDQQMFNKFVKIFGIPIYMADDNHDSLINYTLDQASVKLFESTIDHLSINEDDMRNFLVHISERHVDHTPEAAALLQKYFVASRTARPDCLTKQALIILKQFSESFAKLSLRHEVLPIDVIGAIVLCEHSIEHIFGAFDTPPPHFGAVPFVGAVDEYLLEFQKWLDAYIAKYCKE
ncbi:meiotic 218 [Haematobia irritans]|uniref:meiotic 218 n=1 Tax=Haematobia irritans TaxID=7368 RepID=UPI003F4F7FC7